MPEKIIPALSSLHDDIRNYSLAVLYTIAAISGASGGCLVAAHRVLTGRNMTLLFLVSYTFAGLMFALTGVMVLAVFTAADLSPEKTFLLGAIFGVVGATSLAGMNLSARFLMRRLGVEVDVNIKRIGAKDE